MNWINIASSPIEPPRNRALLCFCEGWCDTGYQVAKWNGKEFYYDEMPNELFNKMVTDWVIFLEAD